MTQTTKQEQTNKIKDLLNSTLFDRKTDKIQNTSQNDVSLLNNNNNNNIITGK